LSGSCIGKGGLLAAGVFALGFGLTLLASDNTEGLRAVLGGVALLGWGVASPLRYSVDLHRRGSVRSLLTTHDAAFASRVSHLINNGLADPAAMPTYRIDPKAKRIMAD
jgi:hypothetical protein